MSTTSGSTATRRFSAPVFRWCTEAVNAWNRFWFEPADPLMLGVIRILTAWMLFYNLAVWTLDLEAFFGNNGLQPLEAVRRIHEGQPVFSFWLWTGDQYLWPIHITCMIVVALFGAGFLTRLTSVLSFLITISYSQRVPVANFGLDQILGLLCLYLSIGPSGAALSLDSLRRRRRLAKAGLAWQPEDLPSARMAMRLIQLHLCAIYFWAGFSKLKGPSWWTGEAMWRVIANQEYQTMDLTWMAWAPWMPYLIAHITIAWEVFFVVLIWNRHLRPLMLAMGVAMHVGIGAFLGMWTFGLIMAFAYLSFSDGSVWRRRLGFVSSTASSITEARVSAVEQVQKSGTDPVCFVCPSPAERSTVQRYLTDRKLDCLPAADMTQAENLLAQHACSLVVISAGRMSAEALDGLVNSVRKVSKIPILTLISDGHPFDSHAAGVHSLQLPVSLKELRQRILEIIGPFPEFPLSSPEEEYS